MAYLKDMSRARGKLVRSAELRLALSLFVAAVSGCVAERRDGTPDSAALADSIAYAAIDSSGCDDHPREWTCRVGGGVRVRVAMQLDAKDSSANPLIALKIFPVSGRVFAHTLPVGENMGEISGTELRMSDLDGDGFGDLLLQLPYGHPNNTVQVIWRFQPAAQRFVLDSALTSETNVTADTTGCVRTSGYLGMSHQYDNRLCLQSGAWIEVSRHDQRQDDSSNTFMEYFYERRGDSLVLVKQHPMEP